MDIDIDTQTHFDPGDIFKKCVRASIVKDDKYKKHPAGVYFQTIPTEPFHGLSSVPYNIAQHFGYFKVDFLHISLLDSFQSKEEIKRLIDTEPDWKMLEDEEVVLQLFQLKNHFDILKYIKPTNVQELADCIALIRPGRRYLLDHYKTDVEAARRELYQLPLPKGCFKKAHAIAYAFNVILQLHAIKQIKNGYCEF